MRVVGIDPGITGGLALLNGRDLIDVVDMPIFDGKASAFEIAALLRTWQPDLVVIEKTQPMPKNGAQALYSLGFNTAVPVAVTGCLGIPMIMLRPQQWKKACSLLKKDKKASRGMAMELWPHLADQFKRVKDDGRAEAALIAEAHRRMDRAQ